MTVEEAKNELEEMYVEFDYTLHDEAANAIDIALKAIEKQIPKKANGGHCPLCGEMLFWEGRVLLPTCPCGQRIDWSDDNDS